MSSRFGHRDARGSLFSAYDASSQPPPKSQSPFRGANGYGPPLAPHADDRTSSSSSFGAYPSGGGPQGEGQFRAATPNKKGQYSDAVLNELESQNDQELEGMSAKVQMLKNITTAIGDEIRDSTALAEKMNDSFENTRVRLRGTMNRMLRMAEQTGVGWRVWLGFFAAVMLLFIYVWLF